MKTHHIIVAAGLMLAVASTPVLAKDFSWTLRVHGAIVESSGSDGTTTENGIAGSVDAGGGVGIGAEYRLNRRVGLEVSTLFAGLQISGRLSGGSPAAGSLELSMMPLTLTVPFHFDPGGKVDLFVGPSFSVVRFLDIESYASAKALGTSVDVDADAALGAALGLDIPFGTGRWAFSSGLRYMKTQAAETDVDPLIMTLGFAVRF